ncbi:hypothetical protein LSG31_08930 [Fodinisporobacter ferrooxydans]|uniref:Transposase n=1 Tax=Fodinisporobacter ferrooxydans TaxID=2901836 RepID=A0ABY4CWI5_9BACL|nr:hypothetical protein LSG31_08930 [Alicyclobacillaceae bacterium MYW30-H2]
MQAITIKIRINPTDSALLKQLALEYIQVVNRLTEEAEQNGAFPKVTTKDVTSNLPSAVLNQAIRDAKSVYRKGKKLGKRPILKKPVYYVNNQNYTIGDSTISFPIIIDGKVKKTSFPATITERDRELLNNAKFGLMRVVVRSSKWYAQVSLEVPTEQESFSTVEMGVDLGLKL